jgi:hypothetical protein
MRYLLLLLLTVNVYAQSNYMYIEQVGSSNQFTLSQDGSGHSATLNLGLSGGLDTSTINVTQQGLGTKTTNIELTSGYSNSVSINQDGNGSHSATIQSFAGSANNISINQSGSSNNTFTLVGSGSNNANNINATQSGSIGADKSFTLNMNSTNGATVTIQQTNTTTPNTGSMSISCYSGCGSYSYIRN